MKSQTPPKTLLHYGAAVAVVAFSLGLTLLVTPLREHTPFILFFPAVMVAAWYGGLGPALVATALSAVTAHAFILPPVASFGLTLSELLRLFVFVAVAVFISTLHSIFRRERIRFAVTLGSIGDAVIATDTQGQVSFMNAVAEALTGWSAHEAVGRGLSEVFHIVDMETREAAESPVVKVLREGTVVGLANHTLLIARDGTERPIDDSGSPIQDPDGRLIGVVLVFRDVTERLQAEQALRASEERFRVMVETASDAILTIDAASTIRFANTATERIFGYRVSELLGQSLTLLMPPELRDDHRSGLSRYLETGERHVSWDHIEFPGRTQSGTEVALEIAFAEFQHHGERLFTGTIRDITARKRREDELRRAAALLELSHEAILVLDLDETIMVWNRGATEIYGWSSAEALGRVAYRLLQTRFPKPFEEIKAELLRTDRWEGDLAQTRRDGLSLVVSSRWALQRDAQGEPLAFLEINSDITARTQMEAQLRASLREKEVLLREIHHRVKNNFQVISSFLNIQSSFIEAPQLKAIFEECQNRIYSMALVHQNLYQANSLALIDFGAYLESLGAHLRRSYGMDTERIQFTSTVEHVFLSIDTAIPCGLLVNELVSNALRHAFPHGQTGRLWVALRREADGQLRLNVRDDGVGLPEGVDFQTTSSFGMQLVRLLAQQLRATITLERHPGTSVTLTFVEPAYQAEG